MMSNKSINNSLRSIVWEWRGEAWIDEARDGGEAAFAERRSLASPPSQPSPSSAAAPELYDDPISQLWQHHLQRNEDTDIGWSRWIFGLVNFITALAYHFCLNLPAAFTQPGAPTLADLCRCKEREGEKNNDITLDMTLIQDVRRGTDSCL